MEIDNERLARLKAAYKVDLPGRMEIDTVSRILAAQGIETASCLDLGFHNPVASMKLRELGGYWTSTVWTGAERRQATEVLGEDVLQVGIDNALPFEDKQFDVVVLARGHLTGDPEQDMALIQECHRILKSPGYLIVGSEYRRRFSLLHLFGRRPSGGYNEREMFNLLQDGFDVLGVKTYCRFWLQLALRAFSGCDSNEGGFWRGLCFFAAYCLDIVFFFNKGYHVIAHGRRKTWRVRQMASSGQGRSLADLVLVK
jgi:SAM-dependent methyltransferase